MSNLFTEPVYPVGDRRLSLHDLLSKFLMTPEQTKEGAVSPYSDLHLKAGRPAYYRCDGDMLPITGGMTITQEMAERLILPFLREKQIEKLHAFPPSDVDASWFWVEKNINFRLNVFNDKDGLAAVMRVLPAAIPDISEIGMPNSIVWQEISMLNQGLVLVTGPAGSGKSTTIAALLNQINRSRPVRVITLEDPIEYIFTSDRALFSQRELGRHMGSIAEGLRSALREDPDIIYVAEMRDPETIGLAMTAAETGHLVFGSLHTRDTRTALTRIIDAVPAERTNEMATQLSLGLVYVLGQKLLSRSDGEGRVMAMEVLKNNPSVANLIRQGQIHLLQSVIETGRREGMNTLEHHLRTLVMEGIISTDEAIQNSNSPQAFR